MPLQEAVLHEIRARLTKVERQNRILKLTGVSSLMIVGSLLVMAQAVPKKTVEANEFILRDAGGSVRATLTMNVPNGAKSAIPQLILFQENGKKGAVLQAQLGFSGLSLYDDKENVRGYFDSIGGLGATLVLEDEHGNLSTRLKEGEVFTVGGISAVKAIEASEVALKDDKWNTRARLFVTSKQETNVTLPGIAKAVPLTLQPVPMLALYDEKGSAEMTLDNHDIAFFNSQGHASGSFGHAGAFLAGEGGAGTALTPYAVSTMDDQGYSAVLGVLSLVTPRTGETQKTSAASLVLLDKDKNVVWKAP